MVQLQQRPKRELPTLLLSAVNTTHSTFASASIASPINLILFSLLILIVYFRLRPSPPSTLPKGPAPVVFRKVTPGRLSITCLKA